MRLHELSLRDGQKGAFALLRPCHTSGASPDSRIGRLQPVGSADWLFGKPTDHWHAGVWPHANMLALMARCRNHSIGRPNRVIRPYRSPLSARIHPRIRRMCMILPRCLQPNLRLPRPRWKFLTDISTLQLPNRPLPRQRPRLCHRRRNRLLRT